jgi:hypothetical protein
LGLHSGIPLGKHFTPINWNLKNVQTGKAGEEIRQIGRFCKSLDLKAGRILGKHQGKKQVYRITGKEPLSPLFWIIGLSNPQFKFK